MVRSTSFKLSTASYTATQTQTSETYYDVHLGKGDEIADRSWNYAGNGTTLKNVSYYEYGTITTGSISDGSSGTRAASTASSEAVMVRSTSFKLSTSSYTATKTQTSETYYDVHLGKGDEVADRSWNYAGNGTTLKNVSYYEYGTITTGSIADGS